ncbi:hypothetical protein [Lewinella sp. IMCC34183]|uniref:hypothetical protein n=1 Tax=Lewinella sp. IMCC34183 TaxID=2248762 RepID=UPI000E25003C|nr:hypothetical protein [Lewinella sp. IMCC34183]
MRILSLCFLCCLLLSGCEGDARNRRAARGADYVSDPDHLYFKNVRSRDYATTSPEEGVDVYTHADLGDPSDLYIIDRWLEDRAELSWAGRVLEPAEALKLRRQLRTGGGPFPDEQRRAAAVETVEDYLRMVGE